MSGCSELADGGGLDKEGRTGRVFILYAAPPAGGVAKDQLRRVTLNEAII